MTTLQIVVVSYNARPYLLQALTALQAAVGNLDKCVTEIVIVDNASTDGSVEAVKASFNDVKIIANNQNLGFAKANNQAIRQSNSDYVLLLNPDTLVAEDALAHLLQTMNAYPQAGAVGPRLISATGNDMPEAHRGLPGLGSAFIYLFGLGNLVPGRYNTYRKPEVGVNQQIEVLSGACMLIRRLALTKVGLLDERFFMYAEDVDLCKRLLEAGYENRYCAEAQVLHYKGRSTATKPKEALQRNTRFYAAMWQYARKHAVTDNYVHFLPFIWLGIALRAGIACVALLSKQVKLIWLEGAWILMMALALSNFWATVFAYTTGGSYPALFHWGAAPLYTLIFTGMLHMSGAYRKPYSYLPVFRAAGLGFLAIATISYVFPAINFSRAIVGGLTLSMLLMGLIMRRLVGGLKTGFRLPLPQSPVVIARNREEEGRIVGLLPHLQCQPGIVWSMAGQRISDFISLIAQYKGKIDIWLAPAKADYLVTSMGIICLNKTSIDPHAAQKRLFDILLGLLLLLSFPLTGWIYRKPLRAFQGLIWAILGQTRLVSLEVEGKPALVRQVLPDVTHPGTYNPRKEMGILLSGIRMLGQQQAA